LGGVFKDRRRGSCPRNEQQAKRTLTFLCCAYSNFFDAVTKVTGNNRKNSEKLDVLLYYVTTNFLRR
jgi:hypothetical protein